MGDQAGDMGNAAAYLDWVRECWPGVFRMARSWTRDEHLAEDVTQQAFLQAWQSRERLTPGTSAQAWIFRIATNLCRDAHRRRRPTLPMQEEPVAAKTRDRLEQAEQARLLQSALETLSDSTREVFLLRADAELSYQEIAEIVGISEAAARARMRQARLSLMDVLKPHLDLDR